MTWRTRVRGWFTRTPPVRLDVSHVRPKTAVCKCCKREVYIWRRYKDGKVECIECAEGVR
jgi:hypothetical protein